MKFTNEQLNALEAKGRVLVSAAAGSGKTAVLTERAVRHMTDKIHPIDADRLLIVTFTSAAAAEMKNRISSKLKERATQLGNIELLKKQQYLLSVAKICTIDSFCISLVRENFYRLGVAPDFKIADNSVLQALKNEAMDNTLSYLFGKGGKNFELLCEALGEEQADQNLKKAISAIYDESCNHPFPEDYLAHLTEMYLSFKPGESEWTAVILSDIEYRLSHAEELVNQCTHLISVDPLLESKYGEVVSELADAVGDLLKKCESGDWDGTLFSATDFSCGRFSAYKGEFKHEAEQVRNMTAEIKKIMKSVSSDMLMSSSDIADDCKKLAPVICELTDAVSYFANEYKRLKTEKNCMEFIDAEYMTLSLLSEKKDGVHVPSKTAKELSEFYYEVMVDEYQDVNDLQNTIFEFLSDNGKNMFMVGDVKQSIYRFRNANPDIFLKNRRELLPYTQGRANGKVIMSGNFRSAPEICEFVNSVFSRLMTESTAGMNYTGEDMLDPHGTFADGIDDRVVCELLDCSELQKGEKARAEACEIVRLVKQQLDAPAFITDGGKIRKARFGDIAVLLRNGNYAPEIRKALSAAGIPNSCSSGGNLLDYREITLLLSVLECINNPYRDISSAAVMLSPLFGFSADELASLRVDSRYSALYSAASAKAQSNEKCAFFCAKINLYREWSRCVGIGDLLRRFCEDSSYFDVARSFRSGEQSRANILSFISIADNFDRAPDSDLIRFLRYVRRAAESDRAFGVKTQQQSGNAVNIITMHSSKGLQYPICILAGLSQRMNRSDQTSGLQLDSKLGFGMSVCDPERRIRYQTVAQKAIKLRKTRLQISEELCVLYVAMTRAKERLIMISSSDNPSRLIENTDGDLAYKISHSSSFTDFLSIAARESGFGEKIIRAQLNESDYAEQREPVQANRHDVENLRERLAYVYPYAELNNVSAKLTASGTAHSAEQKAYQLRAKPMFKKSDKLSAAQRGTACHKFMECCDFKLAVSDINAELKRLCDAGVMSEIQANAIQPAQIIPFFESEQYRKYIQSADRVCREQRFMTEFPAEEVYPEISHAANGERIVVQGAADLITVTGDMLCIVDYKTDRVLSGDDLAEKYRSQLEIYKKAFMKIFKRSRSVCLIYSFYLGKMIEIK